MKTFISLIVLLLTFFASFVVSAEGEKGFHTGPYLVVEGGVIQADHDFDVAANEQVGGNYEPTFGFIFGWNIWDYFSAELQGMYSTNKNNDRRIHIATGNLYAKGTLVLKALTSTNFKTLPFIKAGSSIRASVLPANRNSTNDNATQLGFGPSVGGGIAFLWGKYFYFGVDVQGDLLFYNDINETVNGVPDTLVYKGGFSPSLGTFGFVGVHY